MRDKNLILLILLLMATILLIFFGIVPGAKSLRQDKQIITAEMEKMRSLLTQGQNIVKNKNNLSVVESELGLLEATSLKIGEELNFITDLEKTAARNNIEQKITFNNLEVVEDIDGAKAIPISLYLTGGTREIMSYINDLEKLDYYVNITRISLSANGASSEGKHAGEQTYLDQEENENQTEQPATTLSANLYGLTYWK
jgi:Tfp pilus assembly protein PilO